MQLFLKSFFQFSFYLKKTDFPKKFRGESRFSNKKNFVGLNLPVAECISQPGFVIANPA
jgi:hypothetical protein